MSPKCKSAFVLVFFFQAEDGIRDYKVTGVQTCALPIYSHSLKDKRHVVKGLKDRLRHKFNVSVAEIDFQDLWQRGLVAAVTISSDHGRAEKQLQFVEQEAASILGPILVSATVEWLGEVIVSSS